MSLSRRLLLAAGGGSFTWTGDDSMALGWFNVKTYGATGNGSTDDTSAIDAAIAAWNSAGQGLLYFPAGTYRVTAGLTAVTATGTILGDGTAAWNPAGAGSLFGGASVINCESATAVLFTLGSVTHVEGLALVNTAAGAASAGSAIHIVNGSVYRQRCSLAHLFVAGFYDGIDVEVNSGFNMSDCQVWDPERYGVRIRNTIETDAGGATISGCTIISESQGADAGIRIESSGGNKIIGTNIVNVGTYGIQLDAAAGSSILLISACSIEAYTGDAIHLNGNGHSYTLASVTGCQFGQYGNTTGKVFYSHGISDIAISGCVLRTDGGSPTAVSLNSGSRGYVGPLVAEGFGTLVTTSSFTSLDDDSAGA